MEEVIVTDLRNFIDTSLLRDILWRRWFRQENISLSLHSVLLRRLAALLSQEVGQIDFDTGGRPRSQVIRLRLRLRLLKFEQLLFNHLHLLLFSFHLNTLLLFLSWGQILFQKVSIVSVTTEDALVIHNIHGLTAIIFIVVALIGRLVLKLLLAPHHLGLGTLESLCHSLFLTILLLR